VTPAPLYPVTPQFAAETVELELILDAGAWLELVVELVYDIVMGAGLFDVVDKAPDVDVDD